jgi:hypothetical protein
MMDALEFAPSNKTASWINSSGVGTTTTDDEEQTNADAQEAFPDILMLGE